MRDIDWQQDGENRWVAEVPFFEVVILECFNDGEGDDFEEWDIYFGGECDCWQGPFDSRYECIRHLMECIKQQESQDLKGDNK